MACHLDSRARHLDRPLRWTLATARRPASLAGLTNSVARSEHQCPKDQTLEPLLCALFCADGPPGLWHVVCGRKGTGAPDTPEPETRRQEDTVSRKNGKPEPTTHATPAQAVETEQTQATATPAPTPDPKPPKSKRLTEGDLRTKYPGVVPGSLRWETEGTHANKQTVERKLECGHTVRLATSDLFQVKACESCAKEAARERRKAKRHEKAAARKAAREQAKQASATAA